MSNQMTTTTYSVLVDALIYVNHVTKVLHWFSPGSENNTGSDNGDREEAGNVKQGGLAKSLVVALMRMMCDDHHIMIIGIATFV